MWLATAPRLKSEAVASNQFFQVLQNDYRHLYTQSMDKGWRICVPHSSTISGATFNEDFFKAHILHSSPYFKEEFVTLNGQCVTCKNGIIITKTGFDQNRKVHILSEELFYNNDFKSCTVYCVSGPLTAVPYQSHGQSSHYNGFQTGGVDRLLSISVEDRTVEHHKQILRNSLDVYTHKALMDAIEHFTNQFNQSYVMVKGYTDFTAKKIQSFRDSTFDKLIRRNKNLKNISESRLEELQTTFDTYLASILYNRIFKQLCQQHSSEDKKFNKLLKSLRTLSKETIGIKPQFQCDMNVACQHLSYLNEFHTPIQKLGCLKRVSTLIRDQVELALHRKKEKSVIASPRMGVESKDCDTNEDLALTTDDMLAFFTYCIIHTSSMEHILATCEYLDHLHFSSPSTSHLDYLLATFRGTVQYIQKELASKSPTDADLSSDSDTTMLSNNPMGDRGTRRRHTVTATQHSRTRTQPIPLHRALSHRQPATNGRPSRPTADPPKSAVQTTPQPFNHHRNHTMNNNQSSKKHQSAIDRNIELRHKRAQSSLQRTNSNSYHPLSRDFSIVSPSPPLTPIDDGNQMQFVSKTPTPKQSGHFNIKKPAIFGTPPANNVRKKKHISRSPDGVDELVSKFGNASLHDSYPMSGQW